MESKTLPIVYSITLYRVIEKILFLGDPNLESKPEERPLPFNVKYKLQRNLDMLLKDYAFYESERKRLVKQFGKEEGDKTVVPQENLAEFREELTKSIRIEVEHSFKLLTPEEVDRIQGDIKVSCEEMNLFIAYMVEDKDLVNDLIDDVHTDSEKDVENEGVSKDTEDKD